MMNVRAKSAEDENNIKILSKILNKIADIDLPGVLFFQFCFIQTIFFSNKKCLLYVVDSSERQQ